VKYVLLLSKKEVRYSNKRTQQDGSGSLFGIIQNMNFGWKFINKEEARAAHFLAEIRVDIRFKIRFFIFLFFLDKENNLVLCMIFEIVSKCINKEDDLTAHLFLVLRFEMIFGIAFFIFFVCLKPFRIRIKLKRPSLTQIKQWLRLMRNPK
jgi:hypothetical protein